MNFKLFSLNIFITHQCIALSTRSFRNYSKHVQREAVCLLCLVRLGIILFTYILKSIIYVVAVRSFGMQHDTIENGCEAISGEAQHVMSPQMTAEASPLIWSNCSRKAVTIFLE